MADWLSTMQQRFEYYVVDPNTWRDAKRINTVLTTSISRDLSAETLGSASITIAESLGECYIRVYLVVFQNGREERFPLGTFLVQTPSYSFDGKIRNVVMDAYTPLLELKEKLPPLGYAITKNSNILESAYRIIRENVRAPVVQSESPDKLSTNFISNVDDTWSTFVTELIANAKYSLYLDEMGRILFTPEQEIAKLQPVWTYDDSNSSILHPTIDITHDLYGVPNVVEVVYSQGSKYLYARAVNKEPSSPTSIASRGREIVHRITNPNLVANPSQEQIQWYAEKTLKEMSSIEYTLTYTHAYCPVRIGDCVRLNYRRAGLNNIKAKVISQSIKCEPGCPVTEKAVFSANLWG